MIILVQDCAKKAPSLKAGGGVSSGRARVNTFRNQMETIVAALRRRIGCEAALANEHRADYASSCGKVCGYKRAGSTVEGRLAPRIPFTEHVQSNW